MNRNERVHRRKLEILEWCRYNHRLPSQKKDGEGKMYAFIMHHKRIDMVFKRKLEAFKMKRNSKCRDAETELALQLAESGGTGF